MTKPNKPEPKKSSKPAKPARGAPRTRSTPKRPSKVELQNRELAQDLFYEAMDAETDEEGTRLLEQALELDPENVDALLILSGSDILSREERIEALMFIVMMAEERLGAKAFKELVPHFWGFLETRPYMRARYALAGELRAAGLLDEAAREYAGMLLLNEHDNQGVRYELLPLLLALGRLELAREMMERFKDEAQWSAVFAWGCALERILSNDAPAAEKALRAARKQNPYVEPFLTGRIEPPQMKPPMYGIGTPEEALSFADDLKSAWSAHPDALAWLFAHPTPAKKKPGPKPRS